MGSEALGLHSACVAGDVGMVRSYIAHLPVGQESSALDLRNKHGRTPLMCAAYFGHETIVKLIIDLGCDVNLQSDDGCTALTYALNAGNVHIATLLLERGAIPQPKIMAPIRPRPTRRTSSTISLSASANAVGLLPVELLLYIFRWLDPQDLCRVAQVCLSWNRAANDKLLWRTRFREQGWQADDLDDTCMDLDLNIWKVAFAERHVLLRNWTRKRVVKVILPTTSPPFAITFVDGQLLTGCKDGTVRFWSLEQRHSTSILAGYESSMVLCMAVDQRTLFTGLSDFSLVMWDLPSSKVLHKVTQHNDFVSCMDVNPKHHIAVTCSLDGGIVIWSYHGFPGSRKTNQTEEKGQQDKQNTSSLTMIRFWQAPASIHCVGFATDASGDVLIVTGGSDHEIRLWHITSAKCLRIFKGHQDSVLHLHVKGNCMATGSADGTCKLWQLDNDRCVATLVQSGLTYWVKAVWLTENWVVSGHWNGSITVWDARTYHVHLQIDHGHNSPVMALYVDRRRIISAGRDGSLRLLDFGVDAAAIMEGFGEDWIYCRDFGVSDLDSDVVKGEDGDWVLL